MEKQTHIRFATYCLIITAVLIGACMRNEAPESPHVVAPGILIQNVTLVDGTGSPGYNADVRIRGGLIAATGTLTATGSDSIVDGKGLVLAPGFIDSHSHAGRELLTYDDALAVVSQGITTVVLGQDGDSELPLAEFFDSIEARKVAVNVASYVGHNTLRDKVLGADFRRHASSDEITAMSDLLEQELTAGAIGFSSGLEYDPGIYSDRAEVVALAQVAADAGTRYISHVRSEDRWLEDALEEIIEIGRVTKMPVQVSHIKLAMKRLWGQAPKIIAMLDAARDEGIDITADIYPYEYWQANLMVLLPERDHSDRAAVQNALDEIAPPDGLWMTQFDPQPGYVGMTLTEIAAAKNVDPATAFMQLAAASEAMQEETGHAADAIIGTSMQESDIRMLLTWSETNVCTDGGLVDLHPRSHGAFTRILGRYVREENLLSLEQAVHKMTALTARHLGFDNRGVVQPGKVADLVLFDPATVADRATAASPNRLSVGIVAVWVGGQQVYGNGKVTAARPGVVIRKQTT